MYVYVILLVTALCVQLLVSGRPQATEWYRSSESQGTDTERREIYARPLEGVLSHLGDSEPIS